MSQANCFHRLTVGTLTVVIIISSILFEARAASVPRASSEARAPIATSGQLPEAADWSIPDGVISTPDIFNFDGTYVSPWSRGAASSITLRSDNTIPYLIPPTKPFDEGIYVWDAWPVQNPEGSIAKIGGWVVLVGLTAEVDSSASFPFFTRSTWRYYYTKNGLWLPGGVIFSREEALGSRQWAGSTVYDNEFRSNQVLLHRRWIARRSKPRCRRAAARARSRSSGCRSAEYRTTDGLCRSQRLRRAEWDRFFRLQSAHDDFWKPMARFT